MSTISKPYTFSPSTTASSSEVNADFDTLYNDYNGNINASNLATGAVSTAKIADDAVTVDKIADGAVGNSQLAANTAWSTWVPTWTNVTIGNATVTARYQQIGKTVSFYMRMVFGSTTSISGQPIFSLPNTISSSYAVSNVERLFNVHIEDSGTQSYYGRAAFNSTTTIICQVINVAGTYASASAISSTAPMTWTTGDSLTVMGTYEVA